MGDQEGLFKLHLNECISFFLSVVNAWHGHTLLPFCYIYLVCSAMTVNVVVVIKNICLPVGY